MFLSWTGKKFMHAELQLDSVWRVHVQMHESVSSCLWNRMMGMTEAHSSYTHEWDTVGRYSQKDNGRRLELHNDHHSHMAAHTQLYKTNKQTKTQTSLITLCVLNLAPLIITSLINTKSVHWELSYNKQIHLDCVWYKIWSIHPLWCNSVLLFNPHNNLTAADRVQTLQYQSV